MMKSLKGLETRDRTMLKMKIKNITSDKCGNDLKMKNQVQFKMPRYLITLSLLIKIDLLIKVQLLVALIVVACGLFRQE